MGNKKFTQNKKAVVIFGYPGSGKSTQAVLLAEKFGWYHFDTGKFVEHLVHNPKIAMRPLIKRERMLFDTGKLMDSDFILAHTSRRVTELASGGESIVLSGSPRSLYDAFGDRNHKGLIPLLYHLYGKESVIFILLKVTTKEALARNTVRRICSVCQTPLLGDGLAQKSKKCPFCGGALYTRTLDNPKTILVRFKEYEEKTLPIIEKLKKEKVSVHIISANVMPYIVFNRLNKILV